MRVVLLLLLCLALICVDAHSARMKSRKNRRARQRRPQRRDTFTVHKRKRHLATNAQSIWAALRKQSKETLYSSVDATWTKLLQAPVTTGARGNKFVGPTNYQTVITGIAGISTKFKNELKEVVGLLIHDADDLDYLGQTFEFSSGSKAGHLESVLIVAIRRPTPKDPKSPVEIAFASMITNAVVKPQTTAVKYQKCKKKWFKKKCTWQTSYKPRGLSPSELVVIKNKLQAHQHSWIINNTPAQFVNVVEEEEQKPPVVADLEDPTDAPVGRPAEKAVMNWLSDPETEVRIDTEGGPELEGLREGLSKLESSSFLLQMSELPGARLIAYMKSLLATVGLAPDQEIGLDAFNKSVVVSFEWFTTVPSPTNSNVSTLTYTWLLSERRPDTNGYDLFMMSSSSDMQLGPTFAQKSAAMRTAFPSENGDFSYTEVNENSTPLDAGELDLFLDIIRFTEGQVLLGQSSPGKRALNMHLLSRGRGLGGAISALAGAVDAVTAKWPQIVDKFKSSTNVQVQRIVRLGFTHFRQQTKLVSISGVHKSRVQSFATNVLKVLKVPITAATKAVLTTLEWTNDFTWVEDTFSFTTAAEKNKASTLAVYKHADPATSKVDWFYCKSVTDFNLASDLMVVTTKKSSFGGMFGSTKTEITEVPKEITLDEAKTLQEFFRIIAISKVADKLGLNYNLPKL